MKNKPLVKILSLLAIAVFYLAISRYFMPVRVSESVSQFDFGNASELKDECQMIRQGQTTAEVDVLLTAHNRRSTAAYHKTKEISYWVSDGDRGLYYPDGLTCVVEFDAHDIVIASRIVHK